MKQVCHLRYEIRTIEDLRSSHLAARKIFTVPLTVLSSDGALALLRAFCCTIQPDNNRSMYNEYIKYLPVVIGYQKRGSKQRCRTMASAKPPNSLPNTAATSLKWVDEEIMDILP